MKNVIRGTGAAMAALVLLATASSSVSASAHGCPEGMENWEGYWLYFGRNVDGREVVGDHEWEEFLAGTVSRVLPDGFTVFGARGQWRTNAGVIERERTVVVNVVIPPGADGWSRVQDIASEYQEQFGQEIVLKVSESVCVAF